MGCCGRAPAGVKYSETNPVMIGVPSETPAVEVRFNLSVYGFHAGDIVWVSGESLQAYLDQDLVTPV